jgi:hypothetical protein
MRSSRAGGGGPWWGRERERLRFEWSARGAFPPMVATAVMGGGRQYRLRLHVTGYEPRAVTIAFHTPAPHRAHVYADGPTASPHRHGDGGLCIWRGDDPLAQRWVWSDGLLHLLALTTLHLFKEGWWREHDEWLGPEAPHGLSM